MAVGSRALEAQGSRCSAKLYRRIIGRTFHALVELLTVRDIKDTQCGFKLFRAPVAHDLFSRMRMNGFSFDVELLVMAQPPGLPGGGGAGQLEPPARLEGAADRGLAPHGGRPLPRSAATASAASTRRPTSRRWQALREADPELP